jgi:hypothetical protein
MERQHHHGTVSYSGAAPRLDPLRLMHHFAARYGFQVVGWIYP